MACLAGIVLLVVISASNYCRADATCSETFCGKFCTTGYQVDQNGCDTCQCLSEEARTSGCDNMACYAACDRGYQVKNHCPTCDCAPELAVLATAAGRISISQADSCSDVYCIVPCPSGYQTDSEGCPTCTCIEDESTAVDASNKALPTNKNLEDSWKAALLRAVCRIVRIPGCNSRFGDS